MITGVVRYYARVSIGVLLLVINQGCNLFQDDKITPEKETSQSVKKNIPPPVSDTIDAGGRDTMILLKDGEAFIKGHINAGKSKLTYTLPAWEGQKVLAVLTPLTKGGNVRINQVQLPGGDFDGPFGDTLRLQLKNSGKLKLIIGENLMAGKPYNGDFLLHVRVK